MALPSMDPQSKPRRPEIPVLPLRTRNSTNAPTLNSSKPSIELPSPSETPRFNVPAPILRPCPPGRPQGGRPLLGKLNINSGMGGLPLFQHVAGPARIDDVVDQSSTISPEERTIRPQETDNTEVVPHGNGRGSRKESGNCRQVNGGHGRGNVGRQSHVDDLRESVGRLSIGSLPPSSRQGSFPGPGDGCLSNESKFSDGVLEEISRLGEGAGGAVHKVRDKRDGQIYARKTITTREVAMKQVVRELEIVAKSHHTNIVQCFDAYISPSSSEVKIVMEYCDGGSLEAIGKKIKEIGAVVGEKITGRLAEGILQGLSYLHSEKTIHRDIKPSNILLSRDGIVKLCDFGVSGELVESSVGTFTGTLIYMAPERIAGGKYTIRSDVWSVGISLLELVKNRFPFTIPPDAPAFEVILTISKGNPPKLEDEPEAGIKFSGDMKDFISQALTVDPALRPIPVVMLEHPWIHNMLKQEVDMARWINQVWGLPKPN